MTNALCKSEYWVSVTSMGSLWLGAFVGFVIIAVLGWWAPVVAHLIGGLVAGFTQREEEQAGERLQGSWQESSAA
jgi:hypothetical protein